MVVWQIAESGASAYSANGLANASAESEIGLYFVFVDTQA
jgi:hypothetical protein